MYSWNFDIIYNLYEIEDYLFLSLVNATIFLD